MTRPTQLAASSTATHPVGRRRRVKRGIVAGYIHEISPRHRAPESVPAPAAAPTAAPPAR
jgi:hypothetical protein